MSRPPVVVPPAGVLVAVAVVTAALAVAVVVAGGMGVPELAASSAPAQSTQLGFELVGQLGGLASAVATDGSWAFAVFSGRLVVLEASNPAYLGVVAETESLFGEPRRALVEEGRLYLVDPGVGIHVINVADPASPQPLGTIRVPGTPLGVAVAGHLAYVAAGEAGLEIVDASDVSQPRIVGHLATPRYARDVVLAGDFAYLAERDRWLSGVWVVDVTDPTSPKDAGFVVTPGGADYIRLADRFVYVLGATGQLWVLEIRPGEGLRRRGTASLPSGGRQIPGYPTGRAVAHGFALQEKYAYVAHGEAGLQIVDISFVGRPVLVGTYDTPGDARAVALRGRQPYGFVADWDQGLRVVDLRQPEQPEEVAVYGMPSDVADVAAAGDFLCLADRPNGLVVVDTADPTRLRLAGRQNTPGLYARGVAAVKRDPPSTAAFCLVGELPTVRSRRVGERWVRQYHGGLQIVDVRQPSDPDILGSLDGPYLSALAPVGNYIYAASLVGGWRPPPGITPLAASGMADPEQGRAPANGLVVIDFRQPTAPKEVGWLEVAGNPGDVAVAGNYAYLAADVGGLQIIDVSDPYRPQLMAVLSGTVGTSAVKGVAVAGEHAFLAAGPAGLQVVDVSDPTDPRLVAGLEMPAGESLAADIVLTPAGDHAIVAGQEEVHLVEVSNPARPRWLDSYVVADGDVEKVTLSVFGSLVYVGVDPAQLLVLQLVEVPVPTATPTATSTVTPLPTATATATPMPRPKVYLPLGWR